MDSAKWDRMVARGMLTKGEVAKLQLQGSPGVILYIWAIKILRHNHGPCGLGFRQLSNVKSGSRGGENNSEGIEAPGTAPAESERLLKEINMWASGLLPLQLNMEACVGGTRGLAAKQIAYTLCQFPSIYYQAVHVSVNVCVLLALQSSVVSIPSSSFSFWLSCRQRRRRCIYCAVLSQRATTLREQWTNLAQVLQNIPVRIRATMKVQMKEAAAGLLRSPSSLSNSCSSSYLLAYLKQ